MSDELVVSQCAPTLAGLKTANMFSAEYESREEVTAELRRLNAVLVPKGLRIVPLRFMQSRVLLYLYRPEALRRDLADSAAQDILRECGYGKCSRAESCLSCLIGRLRNNADFPHEVGLFLGYPPEDVQGFIDHHARDFKLSGLWKVYGDEAYARAAFAKYKKCTDIYCRSWRAGSSLERLAVAGENPA